MNDKPRTIVGGLIRRIEIAGYLLALVTLMAFLAKWHWIADLLCNFRVQYVLLLAVVLLILILVRRWKAVVVCTVCLVLNLSTIWSYLPTKQPTYADKSLRIMCANVLSTNTNLEGMAATIDEANPHVVAIIEVSGKIADYFETNGEKYPYRHFIPRAGNFGIAIMSRVPLTKVETLESDPLHVPSYRIQFKPDETTYELIATHPIPPMGSTSTLNRDNHLQQMAESFTQDDHRILMGDFNMTPWSPRFQGLLDEANLVDAAVGFGLRPSWVVFPTYLGGLRIDHILVSPSIQTLNHRIFDIPGSDHRAVVIDINPS